MPIRFFRRRPVAEPPLADMLAGLMAVRDADRIAPMVRALGPRLKERLDLDECLRLAAAGSGAGGTREARFVQTLLRLGRRIDLNATPARHWTGDDRRRLFDPDFLARRCAGDPVLAELNDLLWHGAMARLREAGENPAAVALEAMGLTKGLESSEATAR